MFLKEIELEGFKSFADKTKIEFDKGVTAVVGPNGSGKSNITESLRWALGESSAKNLRGGKMPDVIFAGTQNRNPLNYAKVAVVLDNSDHFIKTAKKEIRVERHIYRNGDSDYLIDGRKVRLRDIHDLFMDTGLGRDSFSIISQGRVEEIFNSKPEERRAIFEEAAGVLKYKTRKKETQIKLNQTQDNLDRLEDIIYELDTQLAPLEKQAKVAKQFLELDANRKQLQLDILVKDIDIAQERQTKDTEALAALQQDLASHYAKRQSMEEDYQKFKQKKQVLSQESDQTQTTLLELTKLIADLEKQIELVKLESGQEAEKKAEAKKHLEQLQEQLDGFQAEEKQRTEQLLHIDQQLCDVKQQLNELSNALERFSSDPDQLMETLREEFVLLMQKEAALSNQLTALKAHLDKEKQARQHKAQEYQLLVTKLDQLNDESQKAQAHYKAQKEQVEMLLQNYQEGDKRVQELERDYQLNQERLFDLLDQKKGKEARKASLESIQKSHSQFYAGVRAVLQSQKKLGGIIGAVSEHLSFDSDYQTALEIALGANSQHIIVTDEAAAKRAIAYLKKNRQGRATFLPLTTIKARSLSEHYHRQLATCEGYLGTAESLVRYDDSLSAIIQNLLSSTAIFETIDQANIAARLLGYKVRIVTLDGTELRPGGSFSGGANRQSNTTFIKPELEQISEELTRLVEQLKITEKEVAALQSDLIAKKEELTQLKLAGDQARLAEQRAQMAYQQLQEKREDSKALLAALDQSQTTHSDESLLAEQARIEEALTAIAKKKNALTCDIDDIKENKDLIRQKTQNIHQALSQARLQERDLLNEKKFEQANQSRLRTQLKQCQQNILKLESILNNNVSQDSIQRLPQWQKQLQDATEHKSGAQKRLVQLRFEIEDYEARLEETAEKITKESEKNDTFIRRQTKLETHLEQVANRLRAYAKSLSEDFQMTLADAKEVTNSIDHLESAKEKLHHLQKTIRALGPINSDAITQYEEVHERLTFLTSQKTDLTKAKNLLLETINSMDSEVKARFKVTFEAIRKSFKETFTQMFGGGSADLVLTETDLLSAGIEISVQPPGKKIQSLNLMSGGEKALSALALLFAIIRVKTIPFVILDEVEAALDEANVKRFGDFLNRFDKDSQFIVVTHRKGTMAAADSIYGITMQESGVSKIVSVKLKEAQEMTN
ncbi:TPA: chromosome segregation protein SMC [Streptococcus pyogenes]|uniref:chromosome segregation protein SMC n=1 Tax=Streptococcus pyogenes TaxID=1314 RepID=UPI0010A1753E|nr:chromosome segregation protein SMC [Streptococcus pyogenes]VGT05974.1 chromosome segregation protein SMC [Streptococcus pyogenes]VGT32917.1 chromosome segregation protein SMC [Streptococcus pyogenes]VHD91080.1 chromosome segregation protein SMC [Streptococcus pyogenes]VHJ92587.1 chromosome segregation protein SMC [Streptococcus pyogenes]VHK38643.1 chromosome segregation protein SMC [Streptococcus pyogenes]